MWSDWRGISCYKNGWLVGHPDDKFEGEGTGGGIAVAAAFVVQNSTCTVWYCCSSTAQYNTVHNSTCTLWLCSMTAMKLTQLNMQNATCFKLIFSWQHYIVVWAMYGLVLQHYTVMLAKCEEEEDFLDMHVANVKLTDVATVVQEEWGSDDCIVSWEGHEVASFF
jgi:hypothetical protein